MISELRHFPIQIRTTALEYAAIREHDADLYSLPPYDAARHLASVRQTANRVGGPAEPNFVALGALSAVRSVAQEM
jgi:hypothetical protein